MSGLVPRPTVEAEFQLTEGTVVVLVDDLREYCHWPEARRVLAEKISAQLVEHDAVTQVVPQGKVDRFRQATTDFDELSITAVGRRLDADQVVSVDVRSFYAELEPQEARGAARMAVAIKVIDASPSDAKGRARLWPAMHTGYPVETELDAGTILRLKTRNAVLDAMAEALAEKIAKLFYDRPMETFEEG